MLAKSPIPPPLPLLAVVRETTAERANAIFNHDAVRPWVLMPGQDAIDFSDFVADPRNVILMNEAGTAGIAFHCQEPGVFECHTAALPEARGADALAFAKAAVAFMFTATDCMELLTKCPAHNRPAEALAKAVGGALDFEREAAWPTEHGPVAVRYYALRYHDWAKAADLLPTLGEWFHDRLEAENARLGIPDELHDDDSAHDRHVGAAVAMILAGQPAKGVILYNRWARFAGYGFATLMNLDPLVVDIGSHVLRVHPNTPNFEVMACRQEQ
jgi:hypothetical protein